MTDPIDVNVTGRLMLLLSRQGTLDNRCLSIYKNAVCDVVRKRLAIKDGNGFAGIDTILDQELTLLAAALQARVDRCAGAAAESAPAPAVSVVPGQGVTAPLPKVGPHAADDAENVPEPTAQAPQKTPREVRAPSGYVPNVKSMEEKLKDERKPIQTLLKEDCVRVGLLDRKRAEKLILGMTGKTSVAAEQDIVEQLRQTLQDQVKSFIRKSKGGPWRDPRTQEELRKDIHSAKSVRSILMLARQVGKEYQTWRDEHHRGGILGLFSPRKRIVQR